MSRATMILPALTLVTLDVGCDRTVADGNWTLTWRLDGRELTSSWVQRYETCSQGKQGVRMRGLLWGNKDTVCWKECTGLDRKEAKAGIEHADDKMLTCLLACDAGIAFVSAHCEPTRHKDPSTLFAK